MPYWLLLRLLLTIVATAVMTAVAVGIAIPFNVLMITALPGVVGFIWQIWSFFNPEPTPSNETQLMMRQSLERQETILHERQKAAHDMVLQLHKSATKTAEIRANLVDQQTNATTLLLESTKEVGHATTTLASVCTTSEQANEAFSIDMRDQTGKLEESIQRIPEGMALLSNTLKEKQNLIESLESQLSAIKAESDRRTEALQNISDQLAKISKMNEDQFQTMATLRTERDAFLTQTVMLTKALQWFNNHAVTEKERDDVVEPTALFYEYTP